MGRFVDPVPASSDRAHLQAVAPTRSLDEGPLLGHVTRVEAGRMLVTLTDEEAVQRATVSALVALHAGDGFLMGIIDKLVCSETSDRVIAHLMPVGAFHPSAGGGGFGSGANGGTYDSTGAGGGAFSRSSRCLPVLPIKADARGRGLAGGDVAPGQVDCLRLATIGWSAGRPRCAR